MIVLIGGGGHCRSVIEAAESAGMKIAGVLERPGVLSDTLGYPILGDDSLIPALAADHSFVVTVGQIKSSVTRRRLVDTVREAGGRFATVVASTARVSRHAVLGEGTVVLHHALVNAGARVGSHCIINSGAIIEHDCTIGALCHVSTNATVNGGATVGQGSFIGSGAVIFQGAEVEAESVVPAAAIIKNHNR